MTKFVIPFAAAAGQLPPAAPLWGPCSQSQVTLGIRKKMRHRNKIKQLDGTQH